MNKPLRIAKFTNVYLPTINGVVTSVHGFRRALTELGHTVFVFAPEAPGYTDTAPYIFRYPAMELPVQKYPLTVPVSPAIDWMLPRLMPQVLHANHPALLGRVARSFSKRKGYPLVFTYHTRYRDYSHYAQALPQEFVKDFVEQWLAHFMTRCHHLVVPSISIKELVRETYGVDKQVSVVSTGIELDRFGGLDRQEARRHLGWPDQPVLVSSGRLAKEKNWETLIRAFHRADLQGWRLVIIGEGDARKRLEKLRVELGLEDRLELSGSVPFEDMPAVLAASDIFGFASVTETQGLVTLEAMATGLPVVAVEASGTSDVVDEGIEGFLTANDEHALAEKLALVTRDDSLRSRLGRAGRKKAEGYSMTSQAGKMVCVYRQAIQDCEAGNVVRVTRQHVKSRWNDFLDHFRPPADRSR